jgi:hypothetical protein
MRILDAWILDKQELNCIWETWYLMRFAIFWDIVPCSPHMSQHFRGIYHLHLQGQKSVKQEINKSRWLGRMSSQSGLQLYRDQRVRGTGVAQSPLVRYSLSPGETGLDCTTRHYIPEDGKFYNYCCENLKSYMIFNFWGKLSWQHCSWFLQWLLRFSVPMTDHCCFLNNS